MIRAVSLCLAVLAGPVWAQSVAESARAAADQLRAAQDQLEDAERKRDRVAALTETVKAYEAGLAALRDGLRAATIREMELSRKLEVSETEVAQLLTALQAIGRQRTPHVVLHPEGPLSAARAGMIVASVTPGLAQKAQALRADLEEVSTLRALQQDAAGRLELGLQQVQEARLALSQAIAARTDLPTRFVEDPVRTAILLSATETLDGFASGLSQISDEDIAPTDARVGARKGRLPLPVSGEILRRAGEPDAAGVERPGILVATPSQALVTTPVAGTVRYAGPLLDYGLVTILEPEQDVLFVFAGLESTFAETGTVLPEGSPLGLMGGEDTTLLSQSGERTGTVRSETLYIEVREGDTSVDPLTWFTSDKG